MTRKEAMELMRTATSVQDWNDKREQVKASVTEKDWHTLYRKIDHNGLIVQTLKANRKPEAVKPRLIKEPSL